MDDSHTPATEADLTAPGTRLNDGYDLLRRDMQRGFAELKEIMREGETELLNVFHSFAHSARTKLKDDDLADLLIRRQ